MALFFSRHRLATLPAIVSLFALLVGVRCNRSPSTESTANPTTAATTIRQTGNGWELLRNGRPYFIKGAGSLVSNRHQFERLRACGGNSIRTWDVE